MKRTVHYVFDKRLLEASTNITNIRERAYVVHSLIAAYNLFSKCKIIQGEPAKEEELIMFHSSEYLNYLKVAHTSSAFGKVSSNTDVDDFNLGYDCPVFENMYDFIKLMAGSSLSAAKTLVQNVKGNSYDHVNRHVDVCNFQPKSYLRFKLKENKARESRGIDVFDLPVNMSLDESESFDLEENCSFRSTYSVPTNSNESISSKHVISENQNVAINWFGGWHHAQRDSAEGFCYVNDIVLAIHFLLKTFKRILYLDLDVHHGNGVENAFLFSPRVFVMSIHKYVTGFYPTTGYVDEVGKGNGTFFTANVPLKDGITDDDYVKVFTLITKKILEKYKPECVVMQCGADSIAGDPLGGFNLTPVAIGKCLSLILDQKLPTLVLGGGGYNIPNVARCWAYLTSVVLNYTLSDDIPDNAYFHLFGPGFELSITPTLRKNENSEEYIQDIVHKVIHNLDFLPEVR